MDDDPRANIVPFGKHRGKTVEEILDADPRYLDWLTAQDWFRDKFVVLHQTIINRGAEPEETPDHNALQVHLGQFIAIFRSAGIHVVFRDEVI
jgi:uncharacterized protein (DUF3820 family)